LSENNRKIPHSSRKSSIVSPLRYPGSKRRLAEYIKQTLKLNSINPELFVEPFAGGASVALRLLDENRVRNIGLIELDPLVAAFWKTVFFDADWLVEQIQTIEVTLEKWYKFKSEIPVQRRDRALACLFLNRTSFSGILARAGPIGGYQQKSQYKIDCRFPRNTLIQRIKRAEVLKDRVAFVWNCCWRGGINRIRRKQISGDIPSNIVFYFDPPFFEKADQLYNYYFNWNNHQDLRDFIVNLEDNWILSYDSAEQVKQLYGENLKSVDKEMRYSTGKCTNVRNEKKEIILSNMNLIEQTIDTLSNIKNQS
jgi:DNA adenine methylase